MDFDRPPETPVASVQAWFEDAEQTPRPNPNAVTLATVDPDGRPSARIVLAKAIDEDGITVYTNRQSRKGRALAANPFATLVAHWDELGRQLVIEGGVSIVEDAVSDAYFATRPRGSQLSAWASRQSEPIESRAALDDAYGAVEQRFAGSPVPRPPHWGGYQVAFESIVFWQAHPFRLHDRIRYGRGAGGGWEVQRLQP